MRTWLLLAAALLSFSPLPAPAQQGLQGVWPHPVVVENRPGGSQHIGSDLVARSAPDGHAGWGKLIHEAGIKGD